VECEDFVSREKRTGVAKVARAQVRWQWRVALGAGGETRGSERFGKLVDSVMTAVRKMDDMIE
jgi:hypothetical protein